MSRTPGLVASEGGLSSTIAWGIGSEVDYALEGNVSSTGSAVQWVSDLLGLDSPGVAAELAAKVEGADGVYMVPAFVGLGAPHWDPDARGAIFGLTLDATGAHLARAALEATAYQTRDLLQAMVGDGCAQPAAIRVDGGMTANNWLCQFLADIVEVPVDRPANLETTALGAAFHAGLATGVWSGLDELSRTWAAADTFQPKMDEGLRQTLLAGWKDAVSRTLSRP